MHRVHAHAIAGLGAFESDGLREEAHATLRGAISGEAGHALPSNGAAMQMPALFTSTCSAPASERTRAIAAFHAASSVTSRASGCAGASRRCDCRARFARAALAHIGDEDLRALGGERLRAGAPDAARRAGDEGDLAGRARHGRLPLRGRRVVTERTARPQRSRAAWRAASARVVADWRRVSRWA